MILLQNISEGDLKFIDDINECLMHNMSNYQIEKIVIFSNVKDIETKIGIDRNSKRVILIKVDPNHFDIIKYGKKKSKDYIIYSTPFIKFNDVSSIMKKVHMDSIAKEPYSYYIFRRDVEVCNGKTIDEILLGSKIKSDLNIQRFGYFSIPNFPIKSIGWNITRNYKEDVVFKKSATPRVDIPVEKSFVPEKIQEPEKKEKRVGNRKIDVVIVSVNYNDFLLISLERNSKIFENITVVTSSSDFICKKICNKFGVKCVVTDIMYEDGALFNKGKAINAGIRSISDPDYILLLDADILVMNKIYLDYLDDESLYTADRYIVPDYVSYQRYVSGGLDKDSEFILDMDQGLGFFQLFNTYMQIDYPESSQDASLCDIIFRDKFDKSVSIDNNTILHLGKESNWKGRKSKSFLDFDIFDFMLEKKSDFKICTFYYNPKNDLIRKENFLKFLDQFEGYEENFLIGMVDYDDDELLILERFENRIFTIKGDKNNPIWYKEILLNKMVDSIDTDYIIWMDCDLIYENLVWLENIDSVVRGNDFVQLYETINYLGLNGEIMESHKSILSSGRDDIDILLGEGYKPGGSWIGKTSILKENRFFEKMYVGGGDTIFLYGLFGIRDGYTLGLVKKNNERIWKDAVDWIDSLGSYSIGYLNISIDHLYHGELKDRNYNSRYKLLKNFDIEEIDSFSDKRIVIYTCISGNYDSLKEVVRKEKNIDYICFTDQDIKSESWDIRPIPKYLEFFDNTKRARCIKILPHIFLDEYDISIWIDGNIQVLQDTKIFLSKNLNGVFCIPRHPDRICVYEEADAVKRMKKDSDVIVDAQVSKYRDLGYPEDFGMVQSNIIIRQHKEKDCIEIGEGWWDEVSKNSKRDQLAFNFSIWKKYFPIYLMDPSIICSDFFQIWTHAGKIAKVRSGYGSLKNYINGIEI